MSYAYGLGDEVRIRQGRNIALRAGAVAGVAGCLVLFFGRDLVTLLFLDRSEAAFAICVDGMPYFSFCAIFIALNLVLIGYYQSIEQSLKATIFTLLIIVLARKQR